MVMKYNPSHETLGKTFTKIIGVMQNIGLTTLPDKTTITPEKLGETIDQMDHYLLTICSWVSNGLFRSIARTHKFLLSGHIHV